MKRTLTRRRFATSAALVAATPIFTRSLHAADANKRVRLGFIGCGGRARQIMPMFLSHADAEIVAVSDVIEPRMGEAMKLLTSHARPQQPEQYVDYRKILDRTDVDAVVIATTQHWHGLPHVLAAQSKKHVFVEKPLSHTVEEGRAMVNATKKHGIVALMGTQQRAGGHYRKAVELVRGGRLGKVALVECWNYHNTGQRTGKAADQEPPPGYHWDLWLGPAPKVPFSFSRLNNSWWFDYAGGMLTNWAVHHIDIILWAMNSYVPTSVSCNGGKFVVDDLADTPDTMEASWEFTGPAGPWLMQYSYRGFNNFHKYLARPNNHGICFQGTKASLMLDRHGYEIWEEADPKKVSERVEGIPYFNAKDPNRSEQDGPWQRMFIDTVQQGKPTPLDLEESHKATVCCHLANIAYLSGRKIRWDGTAESIPGDPEAARLLSRPRRKGFELPTI